MADEFSIVDPGGLQTPRDFVQSGWDYIRNHAGDLLDLAQLAVGDIANFQYEPISFDFNVDLNVDYGTFVRPVAPEVTDLGSIDVTMPTAPTITPITVPDLGEAPAEPDFSGLVYAPIGAPTEAMPTLPSDINPVLDPIEIPDAPDFTLPDLPTLYTLNLPEPPSITLPEFTGIRPTFDIDPLDRAFNWQEVAYDSTLLTTLKSRLSDMMAGGLGLPAHIEQALFDRGRNRAEVLSRKRVQEVAEELAARGLYEPAPYLARRLDLAREQGRAEAAGHNRDITIRATEIEVESIRFAVTQAGALEMALIQLNSAINDRALRAAQVGQEIAQAAFNAQVELAKLDVDLFQADAAVFRDRIQAAIAQAEVYRTQIEGQKALADVNEGLIRAYTEQVRTVDALANVYRSQIEAARARSEINTQRLEQVRIRLQGYGTQVEAWKGLQEAYRIAQDGELGKIRVFEAIGNVYGRRVEAYRAKGDAYIEQGRFQLAQQGLQWDGYRGAIEGVRTQIAAQSGAIDARARTFAARAGMYQAEANVSAAEMAAYDRNAQLRIEATRARMDILAKGTELRITQANQIGTLYVEQLKAKGQLLTQQAASIWSGVNFGAHYSGSLSAGFSYSKGYSYSGDTDDSNPSF